MVERQKKAEIRVHRCSSVVKEANSESRNPRKAVPRGKKLKREINGQIFKAR